ncbi:MULTISPECIES: complex I subunit 5 family protein [unclassified Thiocapsa]|uniref:complex I subunit 5 family protein n=2 Tax=Thiocapsa TaxID=1056 RepID=UPI0035B1FA1E
MMTEMSLSTWFAASPGQLILPVVLPLLAAFLMQPLARVSAALAHGLGPLVLILSAWIIAQLWIQLGDAPFTLAIGGFAPPLGILFYADGVALLFALAVPVFALLFWPGFGSATDPGSSETDREQAARRDALALLLVAATTGLALSGDLFNIYVFYELAAVASFGLVALSGTGRAQVATFRYLMISAFGSVLALVGIAILYMQTGTLNLAQIAQLAPETLNNPIGLASFALMLIGFGVKAELFPVNTWVPEVYAGAPARVSALLAGLVSKLAVLVIIRLLVLIFPQPEAAQMLLVLGVLGVLTGEFAAWRAKDFPRMLAFSSIGQLGLVFIAFSIGGEIGLLAGLAVALHHLIVKSALFGLAVRWNGSLEALAGAARSSPLAAGLFVLFALSLIGVPPLPGFWAKLTVLLGLAEGGTLLDLTALMAILLATAVEASYLFRVAIRLYGDNPDPVAPPARRDLGVAALLGAVLVAATLGLQPVADRLSAGAAQLGDRATYIETVFPSHVARKD